MTTSTRAPPLSRARPSLPLAAWITVWPSSASVSASASRTVTSSSMTSTRSGGPSGVGAGGAPTADDTDCGKRIVTTVPAGSLSRRLSSPPCRCTMPWDTLSPSPVPFGPLVVKNGSNARRRTSSLMPPPVSVIEQYAQSSAAHVAMRIVPLSGMASMALNSRFMMTSRSAGASPATRGMSPSSSVTSSAIACICASSRQRGRVSSTTSRTTSLRSTAAWAVTG